MADLPNTLSSDNQITVAAQESLSASKWNHDLLRRARKMGRKEFRRAENSSVVLSIADEEEIANKRETIETKKTAGEMQVVDVEEIVKDQAPETNKKPVKIDMAIQTDHKRSFAKVVSTLIVSGYQFFFIRQHLKHFKEWILVDNSG